MPPIIHPVGSSAEWTCAQCIVRSFNSSARQLQQFGPEHPRYIEVPEPPQQSTPYRPFIKGVLPVPRDVFSGTSKDLSRDEAIDLSTRPPSKSATPRRGSREEWKAKMSIMRRQNLREGVKSLKARQLIQSARSQAKAFASQESRAQALFEPEREDERLTAPSTTMDTKALMKGSVPDPSRKERLLVKRANFERHANAEREKRLDDLHTLYMNARKFIVTQEDFDRHVEEVFGTDENPALCGSNDMTKGHSIWVEGRPVTVQEILNNNVNNTSNRAFQQGTRDPNVGRITRIAEALTGGKMQELD